MKTIPFDQALKYFASKLRDKKTPLPLVQAIHTVLTELAKARKEAHECKDAKTLLDTLQKSLQEEGSISINTFLQLREQSRQDDTESPKKTTPQPKPAKQRKRTTTTARSRKN